MAIIKVDYGTVGGMNPNEFLANMEVVGQSSSSVSYTFEVGKYYFLEYSRGSAATTSNMGIDSGATVIDSSVVQLTTYYWCGVIQPTSATVNLLGTGNKVLIIPL